MFYSQDILTSPKHGVATIWLVATLGSRSSLKRVNRKAILDVNVTRACRTITDPSAPIALRLQGSLLYGVSRVFLQQCTYVLSDMESLRDHMRSISRLLKEQETDPNVTTTRVEQLNLPIDPAFSIELDLGFDLSGFDTSFSSETSSLLSPRTLASSRTSIFDDDLLLEAPLPQQYSSSEGNDGNGFQVGMDDQVDDVLDEFSSGARSGRFSFGEEDVVILDPDIAIDNDEIVFLQQDTREPEAQATYSANTPAVNQEDDGFQFFQADDVDQILAVDAMDQVIEGNEADVMSGPELPHLDQPDRTSSPTAAPEAPVRDTMESTPTVETSETETIEVAQHRRAKVKLVPIDNPTEISNQTLNAWSTQYSAMMDQVRMDRMDKTTISQGRRNAAFWILEQGIGSVHTDFQADGQEHPLSIFSGQNLLDALGGITSEGQSAEHSAGAVVEERGQEEARQARPRSVEQTQSDQGAGQLLFGDDQDVTMGDYAGEEVEIEPQVGRAPQAPLSEHSDMPWNTYVASSRQGSTRPLGSVAASSSVGGIGAFDIAPYSSMSRRISRLISESPLDRHRMRISSRLGSILSQDDNDHDLGGQWLDIGDTELDQQLAGSPNEDFELDDPVTTTAAPDTARHKQMPSSLDQETFNFLSFLEMMIEQKELDLDMNLDNPLSASVTFEELLQPEKEDNVVAAQGFMHVLSLATRALIRVEQVEDFGDITLSIARD